MNWLILVVGLLVNLPIGYLAIQKKSLTIPGGVLAAGVLGYILFIIHPVYWIVLLVFFGSSTLLTKFKASDKIKQDALSLAEKGGERDATQVAANGGIPFVFAIIGVFMEQQLPVSDLASWYSFALVIAFAVVNADTWATELGVTSTGDPYWILNPTRRVPRGTSGGVSLRGLLASLFASVAVGFVYFIAMIASGQVSIKLIILVVVAGLIGSIIDSVLGATIQAQYQCETCDKLTEQRHHNRCDTATTHERGFIWFSNDLVNLVSVIGVILVILPFSG